MSDEEKKSSRFRRSRFRMPKAPPTLDGTGEATEAPPAKEQAAPPAVASSAPAAPARPVVPSPSAPAPPAPAIEQMPVSFEDPFAPGGVPEEDSAGAVCREITNILTIDVKEWFQTAACSSVIKFSHWNKYERRVERGMHMILALLRQYNVKASFFVLGIVAREFPELIRMVIQEGHEIGTMGYYNRMLHSIPPRDYLNELEMSISLLKGVTGKDIKIHRAPEWSVTLHTLWVMDILKTYGITHDSSIYPVNGLFHGIEEAPRSPYVIMPQGIIECPPTTIPFAGKNIALFGGANMRLLPYKLITMGLDSVNRQGIPVIVHISPWEIEAEFPKLNLGWDGYIAQYAGIKSTFSRLNKLLNEFRFDTMTKAMEEAPPNDSIHISGLGRKRDFLQD